MERFGARGIRLWAAALALAGLMALPAAAQDEGGPHLPPAPETRLPPAPQGLPTGPVGIVAAPDLQVTSAANDHGAYLWIVSPSQHLVTLCEKSAGVTGFACTTKRLP